MATRVAAPPTVAMSLDTSSAAGGSGAYTPVGSMLIAEELPDDILPGGAVALVLAAPDGFEFNPGVGSVFGAFGLDITDATIDVTASRIFVTLTVPTGALPEAVIIADIEVRPNTVSPSAGAIYRPVVDGGDAVVRNVLPSASPDGAGGTAFATLMSLPGSSQSSEFRFFKKTDSVAARFAAPAPDLRVRLFVRDRFGNIRLGAGGRIDPEIAPSGVTTRR